MTQPTQSLSVSLEDNVRIDQRRDRYAIRTVDWGRLRKEAGRTRQQNIGFRNAAWTSLGIAASFTTTFLAVATAQAPPWSIAATGVMVLGSVGFSILSFLAQHRLDKRTKLDRDYLMVLMEDIEAGFLPIAPPDPETSLAPSDSDVPLGVGLLETATEAVAACEKRQEVQSFETPIEQSKEAGEGVQNQDSGGVCGVPLRTTKLSIRQSIFGKKASRREVEYDDCD